MLRDKGNREVEGTSRLFEELDQCCTLCAREYTNINDRGGGKKKTKKKTHTNRLCIELQCSLLVNFKRLRSHYHVGVTQIGFSA